MPSYRVEKTVLGITAVLLMVIVVASTWWLGQDRATLKLAGAASATASAPQPTAASSAASVPPEPATPTDAGVNTESAARSAFNYFIATYNYMQATGKDQLFTEASAPTCHFCKKAREDVRAARDRSEQGYRQLVATNIRIALYDESKELAVLTSDISTVQVENGVSRTLDISLDENSTGETTMRESMRETSPRETLTRESLIPDPETRETSKSTSFYFTWKSYRWLATRVVAKSDEPRRSPKPVESSSKSSTVQSSTPAPSTPASPKATPAPTVAPKKPAVPPTAKPPVVKPKPSAPAPKPTVAKPKPVPTVKKPPAPKPPARR